MGTAGNRLGVSELIGRVVAYIYDDLCRLTRESVTADPHGKNGQVDYTYDAVGNRLSRSSTLPGVTGSTSAYDANDRLLSDTYDNNSNTIASGGNQDVYDFQDHLVSRNNGQIQVIYDGDGNRVSKTIGGVTTWYLVDTNNLTGYAQVVEELGSDAAHPTPVLDVVYSYGLDLIAQSRRDESGV